MSKGRSMLYFLLPLAASAGLAAAPVVAPHVAPVVLSNDDPAGAGCRFLHRGDQSRSLELAVTGLQAEVDENAGLVLAWTEPPFTMHLDGYEYRGYEARASSRGAWVDTGSREPAVTLPSFPSGRGRDFEVVARYRYPLGDGHVYYWYGPMASTEPAAPPNAACASIFGQPDTMLAVE